MLRLEDVAVAYGAIEALTGVSLEVRSGEIVALIGANGAGKTTTLRAIMALLPVHRGRVRLDDQVLAGLPTEEIVRRGVVMVPEGRRIFPGLTVGENLEVGTCGWRRAGAPFDADMEKVFALFPTLSRRRHQAGWSLSGGEQQMLAVGRGLMARPRILLLDEPSLGLAPMLRRELFARIADINRQGTSILLVEQNAYLALRIAHRAYVLENGRVILHDSAGALLENPRVKAAYLGV